MPNPMNHADIVEKLRTKGLLRPSVLTLVLSNLVPVFGVLALGWDVFPIVGYALTYLDAPRYAVVLLVLVKIILDLRAHLRERDKLRFRPDEIDCPASLINRLLGRCRSKP
jgi:hypothetical protein